MVFRGANKQKHEFKKNPKALIWGKPPKLVGGKLLASGYWYANWLYHYF
jgi:Delta14-sterol reductase